MKLENLTFCKKSNCGGSTIDVPAIKVTMNGKVGKQVRVRIAFHSCVDLYKSNTYCRYAIAGNRLYFMFTCSDDNSYNLKFSSHYSKVPDERRARSFTVTKDKELSKFAKSDYYTPKLDNECGLYYIEY